MRHSAHSRKTRPGRGIRLLKMRVVSELERQHRLLASLRAPRHQEMPFAPHAARAANGTLAGLGAVGCWARRSRLIGSVVGRFYAARSCSRERGVRAFDIATLLEQNSEVVCGGPDAMFVCKSVGGLGAVEISMLVKQRAECGGGGSVPAFVASSPGSFGAVQIVTLVE
jgi:hypothetical protein